MALTKQQLHDQKTGWQNILLASMVHGHEGQLNVQTVSKDEADLLQIGEVYGLHLRRL